MNEQSAPTKKKLPTWAIIGGGVATLLVLLSQCGGNGSAGIDMSTATCESLIPHVIEMSQDKELSAKTRSAG